MAFLDNSGDIILDAVLTDYGRTKLANGSAGGTFITSFSFFDDEINYGLYDYTNPSGSAYYDLEIVQTPILEAFTNNASSAKYPLYASGLSTNLFYLPVLKLSTGSAATEFVNTLTSVDIEGIIIHGVPVVSGAVLLASNSDTVTNFNTHGLEEGQYLFYGGGGSNPLRIDVGIDNASAPQGALDSTLQTSTAIIYYDNRFLKLHAANSAGTANSSPLSPNSIDDDNIAATRINLNSTSTTDSNTLAIFEKPAPVVKNASPTSIASRTNFDVAILLKLDVQPDISSSDYYFDLLGYTDGTYKVILTYIQIVSNSTGASINVPIKIYKA
jgi:hypothetical protein